MVAGRTGIILQVVGLEVVLEHGIAAMAQDTNWWTIVQYILRIVVLVTVP
jgi:hypothetical protein